MLYNILMQLYIDSNIYLEYFRENSAERLTPLKELIKLIERKKIILLLPSQTKQEYFRNRRKIAEITRSALVKQSKISSMIPAVIDKEAKEVKDVLNNTKNLTKSYKVLIDKYDREVEKEKTDADLLISELFSKHARVIKESEDIVLAAYKRYMKGNPPRKSDHSYGDAIIWETLLRESENDDLVLITKDGDFIEIHKGKPEINQFLFVEWKIKTKKKKKVKLYKSLAEFVNTFNKKEVIKKEIVQKENNSILNPSITKSLSYSIKRPVGSFDTVDSVSLNNYSSVISLDQVTDNSALINQNIIPSGGGIFGISTQQNSILLNSKCNTCGDEIPNDTYPSYCPRCGSFNYLHF